MPTGIDSYKRKNVNKETINPFLEVKFSKNDYILVRKNSEEYVVSRVRNYNRLKTKTTQSILSDLESAKQYLQGNLQCYQYKHCTDHWLTQIDPCTSGQTRNTDGKLLPLGSVGNIFQMSSWNLQNERQRWCRIPYVTKKRQHYYQQHHHKRLTHKEFMNLFQNRRSKIV